MFKFLSENYSAYRSNERLWLFVALAAACAVMLPMPLMGVPEGYDIADHLMFATAYRDAILNGDITAPWAAASNYGFGSVGTRFYPPMADFLLGLTNVFTNDWYDSFLINAFFWMIPGCVGMYYWAKEYLDPPKAAFAAAMFALMPYHLFQIYQFTLFSEFAAAAILPFCFLFITRLINRGSAIDVLFFAISYSLLILTHIPTTVTGTLALGVYALFLIDWSKAGKTTRNLLAAACLTLTATAFFWLRMVSELSWVAHNSDANVSGSQAFSYHLFPIFLTARAEFYRLKMMWLLDSSTILTILTLVPVFICVLLWFRRKDSDKRQQKLILALAGTGLMLIFLVSVPSKIIWTYAPVLHKIQFPWRFLSPASVIAAFSFALAVPLLYAQFPKLKRLIVYGVLVILTGVIVFDAVENIISSAPYSRALFQKEYGDLDKKKSCDCWLTAWANERALLSPEKVMAGGRAVEITEWETVTRHFAIAEGEAGTARIATLWYPYWQAKVNGSLAEVRKDEDGVILITIPAERSEIQLYFQDPLFVDIAKYISLLAWIGLIAAVIFVIRRRKTDQLRLAAVS